MANTKFTALTAGTPATSDIIPFISDPAGTPIEKKTTVADIGTALNLSGTNTGDQTTTAGLSNSTNKNLITDAQLTVLGNTSGTNSGDNAANSTYASDYRAANFVAGTDYLAPTGSAAGLTSFPTLNQNTTGYAEALKSATTTVSVSAATAPTTGQVLTATGASAATWQTPTGGGQTLYEAVVATSGGDYTTLGAAITAGKTRIFVRNGTYVESTISTATASLRIVGESQAAIISMGTNSATFSGANCSFANLSFTKTTSGVITFSGTRARVFNCAFSGTATTTTQLVFSGSYSIIEMCTLGTFGDGAGDKVTLSGDRLIVRNCQIDHGHIGNSASYGFFSLSGNRVSVEGCTGELSLNTNDSAFRISGGDQIRIANNTLLTSGGKFVNFTNTADHVSIIGNCANPLELIAHHSAGQVQGLNCMGNSIYLNGSTSAFIARLASTGVFNGCNFSDNVITCNATMTTMIQLGGDNNIVSNNIKKGTAPTTAVSMISGSDYNLILGNQFQGGAISDSGTGNVSANNI